MHHPLSPWARTLGALGLLLAAAGPAPAEPATQPVEVLPLRGAARSGTWLALGATTLTLQEPGRDTPSEIPLAELRELRAAARAPARAQDRLRVTLVNGDVLLAESYAPAPDGLEVRSASFGTLALPFDVVRSLEPLAAKAGPCQDAACRLAPKEGADRLALVGGDELSGTLLEARADGLRVELERGRERTVAWADLLVAQFNNPTAPPALGGVTEIETQAGDLLHSTTPPTGRSADGVEITLVGDARLVAHVPWAEVRALRWRGVGCVDATLLAFRSTYTPLLPLPVGSLTADILARERGVRVGRRPRGCPLRLDGTVYVHGFAVHSGSTVTLPLDGNFRAFEALVGIDDEAKEAGRDLAPVSGDVDVRVLGDGRVLWEAKGVVGLTAARRVGPLDVTGVKELVLVVDYGGHYDMLDRVTWADPVLLR